MTIDPDKIEAVARAICFAENHSIPQMGDEICCAFAPASRRRDDGNQNNNPDEDDTLRCCWDDYAATAEAAIEAGGKWDQENGPFCDRMKRGTCGMWMPDDGPACGHATDDDCQVGIEARKKAGIS